MSRNTQIVIILFAAVILYGIVSHISSKRKRETSGGNITFVAKNITLAYRSLCDLCYGISLSEEKRLFAAAYICAEKYIEANKIALVKIALAATDATSFTLNYNGHKLKYGSYFDETNSEHARLIHFIMQMEALMFVPDNPALSVDAVLRVIADKRYLITQTVEKIMSLSAKDKLIAKDYSRIRSIVMDKTDSVAFRSLVDRTFDYDTETYFMMTAKDGSLVRVPASKLEEWEKSQEQDDPLTPEEENMVQEILRKIYGDKNN